MLRPVVLGNIFPKERPNAPPGVIANVFQQAHCHLNLIRFCRCITRQHGAKPVRSSSISVSSQYVMRLHAFARLDNPFMYPYNVLRFAAGLFAQTSLPRRRRRCNRKM